MERGSTRASQFPDGAADVARRFGITIKALRLYERAGLIRPVRDDHGWRTYGQTECERLHLILLLRRIGLSVARIGEMLAGNQPDIAAVLDLQAAALTEQQERVGEALALIGRARQHLAEHGGIDREALAALARTEPLRLRRTPALRTIAQRCFTPDQRLLARKTPPIESEWAKVYRELAAIIEGSPKTPRAQRLGARAASLIERMTEGDPVMRDALARFWEDSFAEPVTAQSLPLSEAGWHFLGQAMAANAGAGR